ncbi:TolC family protein [Mucilaginibacter sp. JRF]|uniref:TolC family protein n=1 Tax=Mucilaginibacter sp. JRF TaxID=2780088 RepID=UPI00187FD422|nr:TolC family protein [Mucilaginibacter sp. JRF]MBE9586876.1 TolC family protein [Mucilaginibacter sp. JRF]
MRYFLFYITTALVLLAGTAQAQTDTVYNLQKCLDIAVQTNLDVKRSELEMERQHIYWKQARLDLLPTINGSVDHSLNSGRSQNADLTYVNRQITNASYSLNGNLTLFNGLAMFNNMRQTALAYQAGQMDFQQAKNDISLNVITTYLLMMNNEDQVTQAETQVQVSKQQADRLDILNKDGNVTPTEYYNLKGQLAADQLSLITAKNNLISSRLDLFQLMNIPYKKTIRFERLSADQMPAQYKDTEDEVYNTALNDLAQVKAAELRVKGAEKSVKVAQGNIFPVLSLYSGVFTQYSSGSDGSYSTQFRNNYNTSFGLNLSIPFLNGFRKRNQVALAKINLREAQYVDQTTKVQLKQNVEQAYTNMANAFERYRIQTDQVTAYAEAFRTTEVKFNAGAVTSVEFVIAKGNLDRSRTNLIVARYDYFIRTKILDYYQNRLSFN